MKKIMFFAVFAMSLALSAADLLESNFKKGQDGWSCPSYWSGKIRVVDQTLELLPAVKGNKSWVRGYKVYHKAEKLADCVLEITSVLSGKGKARLGAIIYTRDFQGKSLYEYTWSPEFPLNETPTEHRFLFDLNDYTPYQLGLCVEIIGKEPARCQQLRLRDVSSTHKMETVWLSEKPDSKIKLGPAVYSQSFDAGVANWLTHSYWGGKLAYDKAGWLELSATKHDKREYGAMDCFVPGSVLQTGGLYEYSAKVKGEGKVRLGATIYGKDSQNKQNYSVVWGKETTLTSAWRRVKYVIDLSKHAPASLGLRMELTTPGTLCADDVSLRKLFDPYLSIKASMEYAAWCEGKELPNLEFQLSDKTAVPVLFVPRDPATPSGVEVACDDSGKVRLSSADTGNGKRVLLAARGQLAGIRLDKISPEEFEQYSSLARKADGKKIKDILIIGDSLLDKDFRLNLDRGAIMQLNYWLNMHKPGRFNIHNAAVRGDYIERVWERMSCELKLSTKTAFSQSDYDGLFKVPADIIFVLLGHNDTKAFSKQNFSTPLIPPDKQVDYFRKVLTQFRKTWPDSRIVLVSNTCTNYELTKGNAERSLKKSPKRNAVIFGIPEFMEQYNTVLKGIAPEFNADFYDIYTPMKALKQEENAKLLNPHDGVHLSDAGQSYLMLQFLKYLAELK